ncbi:HD domain-containing protein [Bosea sp. 124]|uniref:HD-GYP domain-containing protein n=1 Tax=Bosea sp. 124 TaxID=2135642 RepID=UPI000D376DC1|nr:HD domain-containing protein [Bosea sp. 124]PTM42024.1 HD-GYP domain-containing protein (c-di-GMP phosphodiesterase class II) [Bosea sp. 124]
MALEIRLAEILGSLSRALDLTEGQPPGHCVRCCWIGVNIGHTLGLSDVDLRDLYYMLLLKDLGCSSNAARICDLYLADDLAFKKDFKLLDGSLPQVLRFVLSHTGAHAGLAERFRSVINILRNGGEIARELIETRCQRGADIARQMRFSDGVASGILDLDEHWDGGGKPLGRAGESISLSARIALLAQVVDVFHSASGPDAALAEASNRSGQWFDPAVVAAFVTVAQSKRFWTMLGRDDLEAHVLAMEPGQEKALADEDYLDDIAQAFARVIDAKSPFTSGHSERVAVFSDMIAEEMGFDGRRRRWLRRAALLHDVGKLGVSNSVLDKNGKLDEAEWQAMRGHAGLSEAILSRISAFADLSKVAGAHHERLDGKGYPRGLTGEQIEIETRIVSTADVFDALTADRPYRAAMPISKALAILREGIGSSHDPLCIEALERALDRAAMAEAA